MSGYRQMNYMNGHEGHRFQSYGKRSADAEPTAEADADAWYHPYSNFGYNWNMNNNMNFQNNWPMMSGYRQMNYMNGHEGHRFQSYGKRSADAEADAWYHPYSNWGSNWNMYNNNNMYNNMNYMNRPYYH